MKPSKYDIPKEELEKYYIEEKMSRKDICKIYGCHENTIGNLIKKHGIEMRSFKEAHLAHQERERGFAITIKDILALDSKGYLMKEIAEHYGVTAKEIYGITSAHGYNFQNGKNQRHRASIRRLEKSDKSAYYRSLSRKIQKDIDSR